MGSVTALAAWRWLFLVSVRLSMNALGKGFGYVFVTPGTSYLLQMRRMFILSLSVRVAGHAIFAPMYRLGEDIRVYVDRAVIRLTGDSFVTVTFETLLVGHGERALAGYGEPKEQNKEEPF